MCPPKPSNPFKADARISHASDAGFSLLELLVVLAILGIVLSLAGARMLTSLDSARFVRTADAAAAQMLTLRAEAMLGNEGLVLLTDTNAAALSNVAQRKRRRLDVPPGWRVEGTPVMISAAGVCGGGQLRLLSPTGRYIDYALSPPKCVPQRIAQPARS